MPKSNIETGLNNDTHSNSSKKWFTKISLKIPKKLKNGKSTSTLTNAINASKKSNNSTLDIPETLLQYNPDNSISNKTICDSLENTSICSGSFLNIKDIKDGTSSIQSSQVTINTTKNETAYDENSYPLNSTPIICISSSDVEQQSLNTQLQNMTINDLTSSSSNIMYSDITRRNHIKRPSKVTHRRSSSDNYHTPTQRPRSYSDTPVPSHSSVLYCDEDEYVYEIPRKLNQVDIKLAKDNYYNLDKDMDMDMEIYDIKTPILTTTPSNTITGKVGGSIQSMSVTTTPVLKPQNRIQNQGQNQNKDQDQDYYSNCTKMTPSPDRKLISIIESMQNKKCGNMTAKEFALAVGIDINANSDSSDDEDEREDKNSICTLSSTLSQLTANGKIPTANEIYNALSIKSRKRKQSAPILNLEMFIPPSPKECNKTSSCNQSIKGDVIGKSCQKIANGDLYHEIPNVKLEKRLPPTTNKSNGSGSTYVATNIKGSSASSIHSSLSGNTTTCMSDLPDNDCDSYCSSSSYLQQSMMNNGIYPLETNGNNNVNGNNITTTFYSLPRVKFHSSCSNNTSPITASKSINSVPSSNIYVNNYNAYRDMGGIVCNSRRHSRVASSISINSQTSSVKKVSPPSPSYQFNHSSSNSTTNSTTSSHNLINSNINIKTNAKLHSNAINSLNASKINNNYTNTNSDHHNMYINSRTIAISNNSSTIEEGKLSPVDNYPYPLPTSWSNGLTEVNNFRLANNITKQNKSEGIISNSKETIEVYTKGRFTITHEHYNHNRTASTHKFQIEKY